MVGLVVGLVGDGEEAEIEVLVSWAVAENEMSLKIAFGFELMVGLGIKAIG